MNLRDLTRTALCTAFISVCALVTIPGPVPFTLQTFGVFLTLLVLGGRQGTYAILAYLLLGAFGAPVFAGMQGGLTCLVSPTGGYLIGFLFQGLLLWHGPFGGQKIKLVLGQLVCYGFGTLWYAYLMGISVAQAALWCVVPFLLPDALKLILAWKIAGRLRTTLAFSEAYSESG